MPSGGHALPPLHPSQDRPRCGLPAAAQASGDPTTSRCAVADQERLEQALVEQPTAACLEHISRNTTRAGPLPSAASTCGPVESEPSSAQFRFPPPASRQPANGIEPSKFPQHHHKAEARFMAGPGLAAGWCAGLRAVLLEANSLAVRQSEPERELQDRMVTTCSGGIDHDERPTPPVLRSRFSRSIRHGRSNVTMRLLGPSLPDPPAVLQARRHCTRPVRLAGQYQV